MIPGRAVHVECHLHARGDDGHRRRNGEAVGQAEGQAEREAADIGVLHGGDPPEVHPVSRIADDVADRLLRAAERREDVAPRRIRRQVGADQLGHPVHPTGCAQREPVIVVRVVRRELDLDEAARHDARVGRLRRGRGRAARDGGDDGNDGRHAHRCGRPVPT